MKKVSIALMILMVAVALNGCTYSSGTKVASGGTNPPTDPNPPSDPNPPTNPPPTNPPPPGTPTPVAPTNPAPIAIPPAGTETMNPVPGTWTTQTETMPINPVHGILLKTGNVLYIAGSGNCPPGQQGCPTGYGSATIWNPTTNMFTTFQLPGFDMFCNGATQMADGKIFINSGTETYATGPAA